MHHSRRMSFPSLNVKTCEGVREMTHSAEFAAQAWRERQRRRTAAAALDRVADAALAAGGAVVANAALSLQLGLPSGGTGLTFGAALLVAGILWIARARHAVLPRPAGGIRHAVYRQASSVAATATPEHRRTAYRAA